MFSLFDKVETLLKSKKFNLSLCGRGDSLTPMTILDRELKRLKDEATKGQYDI